MSRREPGVNLWERWFWVALGLGVMLMIGLILTLEINPGGRVAARPGGAGRAAVSDRDDGGALMGSSGLIAQDHYNLALELVRQGNLLEAREFLARAVDLVPTFAPAWNNLGATEMRLGDLEKAEADFNRARRASPQYLPAYYNLAGLLAGQNRRDEAMKVLEDGVAALGARPELIQRLAELGLGLGMEQRALNIMDQAGADRSDRPELAELKAMLLARLGRQPEAERVLQPWAKAVQDPAANGPRRVLARLLLHRGEKDRAEALLETNLSLTPDSRADHLALVSTRLTRLTQGILIMPLAVRGRVFQAQNDTPLYSTPGPAGREAGLLQNGDQFMVLGEQGGWTKVIARDAAQPFWAQGRPQVAGQAGDDVWPLDNLAATD